MARFDIYPNPEGDGYLLDIQADLLSDLNTRIVIPMLPVDMAPVPAKRLNPVLVIEDEPHVLVTQFLAAVPASILTGPIANQSDHAEVITNALDMAFFGF